ncbi:SH3 domain-containing protein [Bartonella sp. LJL80]
MKKIFGSFLLGSILLAGTAAQAADAIATTTLNFRAGPGTGYAVRGSIPAGQPVSVRSCAGNWCQINYGPRTGWASSRYLAFRSSNDAYNSYTRPSSSSFNVIIGSGYYDDRYWGRDYDYYRPRPPHWNGHHRPPPHWDGNRPHRPPPGMRPPPFRPGPGMRPPSGGRPPEWSHGPGRPNPGRPVPRQPGPSRPGPGGDFGGPHGDFSKRPR